MSSVLHALNKRSFDGFVAFCECLIETGQAAVIVEFLTPELHELRELRQQQPSLNLDVRHVAAQDTASSQLLAVVDLRQAEQEDEEAAAAPTAPAMVVDYDWKSVIRENFMQLTRHVDPDSGLLNQLQSRGVISHVSADVIRVYDFWGRGYSCHCYITYSMEYVYAAEPFRFRANSLPGAKVPIRPWPIHSLEVGTLALWSFRSQLFIPFFEVICYKKCTVACTSNESSMERKGNESSRE